MPDIEYDAFRNILQFHCEECGCKIKFELETSTVHGVEMGKLIPHHGCEHYKMEYDEGGSLLRKL